MKETKNNLDTKEAAVQYDSDTINSLINNLASKDELIRRKAHDSLIAIGESVVSSLVKALSDPRDRVRWEVGKILDEIHVDWTKHADAKIIKALVDDLTSKDGRIRVRARSSLVSIGGKSLAALVEALKSKEEWKRWEAAKALGQIGDPEAIGALITALEDEMFDVRWLSAEGLIAIGPQVLVPLLHRLTEHPDSLWLHEGAHRILHGIVKNNTKVIIQPVLNALEGDEVSLEVPFAAETALKSLE